MPIGGLIKDAMQFAFDLDRPIYDCLNLALASQGRLPLVIADKRLTGSSKDKTSPSP